MERATPSRNSSEYAEMLADVFVETVRKAAVGAVHSEPGGEEITPSLMQCLQFVYLHGDSPVREIASGLGITLSAASQLVDKLVKRGLATRRESEDDRRLTRVGLTECGATVVRQARDRRSAWFESMLDAMPEPRRKALVEGMESFLRAALAREDNIDRACVKCGLEHNTFCVISKLKAERGEGTRA